MVASSPERNSFSGGRSVAGFERAFSDVEKNAAAVLKSASGVMSHARALARAARSGNLAAIERCRERLGDALVTLRQEVSNADSSWPFTDEEEKRYFEENYAGELRETATAKGLKIHERDGLLFSYPSVVRVLPADRSVRIDRKKVSSVRPSHIADLLLKNREKSSGFSSSRFLEALYLVYKDVVSDSAPGMLPANAGRVVPLARIYALITALPGAARDYDRSDFARDIFGLDSKGPRKTKDGAEVSFPTSTGTKSSRNLFSFVGPGGHSEEYYGIRFGKRDQ